MKDMFLSKTIEKIIVILILLYQNTVSFLIGPSCRFSPSCSNYALLSIRRFGVKKGITLSLKRLIKCHPFHPGGYDPVPDNNH